MMVDSAAAASFAVNCLRLRFAPTLKLVEQTRAARLKHFTLGHVVSTRGAMPSTGTRDEDVKAPTDVIDLTGD
jgi:hypothetical protein